MTAIFKNLQGELLPVPKARTLAAIKRAYGKCPDERTGGIEHYAMRAVQYALAMEGQTTGYRSTPFRFNEKRQCQFSRAPDGSNRVSHVFGNEIPNWDFVATCIEVQGAFA